MKYRYSGVNRQREKVNGVLEARDEVEAKVRLRAMAIRPSSLKPATAPTGFFGFGAGGKDWKDITIGKAIDLKGLSIFTRQFSSLIDSGVPVVQCLDIL